MADGLYLGMAGATARAAQLDSIADNLANAQTPGFKPARPAFESFLAESGAADKVYAAAVGTGIDMRPGQAVHTGNPLDVLPEGDGLLAVRTASGATAFTRAGRLTLDPSGQLLAAGLPVLDPRGEPVLIPPQTNPEIAKDGTLSAEGREFGKVALWRAEGPMGRNGPQLLVPGDNTKVALVPDGTLRVGELELGSYTPLEATVQLVEAQRQFDSTMQALQTYRTLDQRAVEVGRIR
ncbi:MAG: flagellar hook basal-body protein [Myxococcales bacterium]